MLGVPAGKGKHPAKRLDRIRAVQTDGAQNNFRIAGRPKFPSISRQTSTKIFKIVDFPVVSEYVPAYGIYHRLRARRRKIQN